MSSKIVEIIDFLNESITRYLEEGDRGELIVGTCGAFIALPELSTLKIEELEALKIPFAFIQGEIPVLAEQSYFDFSEIDREIARKKLIDGEIARKKLAETS